jgi:hypothetical protein
VQLTHLKVPLEFLELAHVPAELRDHELGTGRKLAEHLVVLQILVADIVLERVHPGGCGE